MQPVDLESGERLALGTDEIVVLTTCAQTNGDIYAGLVADGRRVELLAHVLESKTPDNDVPAVREFAAQYAPEVTVHVPQNLQEVRAAVAAADLAIVVVDPDPARAPLAAPALRMLDELGVPHLVFDSKLRAWSPGGYGPPRAPDGTPTGWCRR